MWFKTFFIIYSVSLIPSLFEECKFVNTEFLDFQKSNLFSMVIRRYKIYITETLSSIYADKHFGVSA